MSFLPLAGRAGVALAALVAIVIAAVRPAAARRAARRVASLAATAVARTGRLVLFAEHKMTRRRRVRGRPPLAPVVRLAGLVDTKAITPCEQYTARTTVTPVGRGALVAIAVAALVPSAAWLVMHQWPSSAVGRGVRASFARWSSIEVRAHLASPTRPVANASPAAGGASDATAVNDAEGGASIAPVVRSSTISRLSWTIVGTDIVHLVGADGDVSAPADYNGDGQADIAAFRPSTGEWFFDGDTSLPTYVLGAEGDVPVPADYDGDGRAEPAVFRPSTGQWFIAGEAAPIALGADGDVPVPADYDGDGRAEPVVFRPSNGQWLAVGAEPVVFGQPDDVAVPGAYLAAGRAARAVFRPATNEWWIEGEATPRAFGEDGDVAMVTDLDGDGRDEPTVFRPTFGDVIVHGRPVVETGSQAQPVVLRDRHGSRLAVVTPAA